MGATEILQASGGPWPKVNTEPRKSNSEVKYPKID